MRQFKNNARQHKESNYDYFRENEDGLVIEDNTIYEIDMDCYECLMKRKREVENKDYE